MPVVVEPTRDEVEAAAGRLRDGRLVAFPTETVYGLGGDTYSEPALAAIFAIKGRPANNPLIAHVLDASQAARVAASWDTRCDALAEAFWPGPLTLVLPRRTEVPRRATAGLDTIAVRAPAHPVARRLLDAFGGAISAPSANRSGRVSPTTAAHVLSDLSDVADARDLPVLDGGPCGVGIESTVLDLSSPVPSILRPGAVTAKDLAPILGRVEVRQLDEQAHAPGTAPAHYAPTTPCELVSADMLTSVLGEAACAVLGQGDEVVGAPHHLIRMPRDAEAYGARLYAALREADSLGVERILVVDPVRANEPWDAILDRLQRASGSIV